MLFVIVGLGNPGRAYGATRHNLGFRVLQSLTERHDIPLDRERFSARTGIGMIAEQRVLLVEPMTFMNLSGQAVSAACRFYKVPVERLAVVHDDVDLDLGRIQVRRGGGHGGHRGLRSVIEALGDDDFVRVRVGINRPNGRGEVSDFVLTPFEPQESPLVDEAVERAAGALETWLREGLNTAMNRFNPWTASEGEN